jgi:hypothetical protein
MTCLSANKPLVYDSAITINKGQTIVFSNPYDRIDIAYQV